MIHGYMNSTSCLKVNIMVGLIRLEMIAMNKIVEDYYSSLEVSIKRLGLKLG